MSEPLAFLNGQFLPQSQATLSFSDAGFVFGATVTDFCRTFRHRPYLLEMHLSRFMTGAASVFIPPTKGINELMPIAEQLIVHNAALLPTEQELALISFLTPGPIGYYAGKEGTGPPTLGMHTFPLPFARYAGFFRQGVHLITPTRRQIPRQSIPPSIKHRSRLPWWLASQEVRRHDPEAVALLLDRRKKITETALANFLIVRDGTVLTPPAKTVLWGISLEVVQQLCERLNVPFAQQTLSLDDCRTASEAMLCGTAFCLAGVSRINDHFIPWPGPVFGRLLAAWSEDVGLDISSQFFPLG